MCQWLRFELCFIFWYALVPAGWHIAERARHFAVFRRMVKPPWLPTAWRVRSMTERTHFERRTCAFDAEARMQTPSRLRACQHVVIRASLLSQHGCRCRSCFAMMRMLERRMHGIVPIFLDGFLYWGSLGLRSWLDPQLERCSDRLYSWLLSPHSPHCRYSFFYPRTGPLLIFGGFHSSSLYGVLADFSLATTFAPYFSRSAFLTFAQLAWPHASLPSDCSMFQLVR